MEPNIALVAGLIGDPARSRMLIALMGGRALTATELALEADITPQTASSHLGKLVDGDLVVVRKQGRHKYFQLRGVEVAELLEMMLNVTSQVSPGKVTTGPADPGLRRARVCYDHLAGELGVALYDSLVEKSYIVDADGETRLTPDGRNFFGGLGVSFEGFNNSKRPLCKSCLDWSERRSHLAGALGQWLLADIFARGWARKNLDSRAVLFTQSGFRSFVTTYGVPAV